MSVRALVPRMLELRAEGHSATYIGNLLGLSASTVRNWWNASSCIDCGCPVERSSGESSPKRCPNCSHAELGQRRLIWTRERIIEAIRWWADTFGEPPAVADWDPNKAIVYNNDLARARRAERLIAEQRIPWFMTPIARFGSWNAAIEAAGFAPRRQYGVAENHKRRRVTSTEVRARELEAVSPTRETGS